MRPSLLALPACALLLAGCPRREATALQHDLERIPPQVAQDLVNLRAEVASFARAEILAPQRIPAEADRLLSWRRDQWWLLQEELAWHLRYEWLRVEALSLEAARLYGYEITNFPKAPREALTFLRQAPEDWRRLVQDATIFLEYQDRELVPLRRDLAEAYDLARWELGSLRSDVHEFLAWRDREYAKLRTDLRSALAGLGEDGLRLLDDLQRFRALAAVQGERLLVDLKDAWGEERRRLPRLLDDASGLLPGRDDLVALRRDLGDLLGTLDWSLERLEAETRRFTKLEREKLPALMLEVDRLLRDEERQGRRLSPEVQAFWRQEIAARHLLLADLRAFLAAAPEEASALQEDIRSFLAYGRIEWDLFKRRLRSIATGEPTTMGDEGIPWPSQVSTPAMWREFSPPEGYLRDD